MRIWLFAALLGLVNAVACDRGPRATVTTVARDSAGVHVVDVLVEPESLPQWSLESSPVREMNGKETGDETAFAFIGPVRFLLGGGLVVGDVASSRLLIYDVGGRFLRLHGRRGEGPGEIRRLESITAGAGDTLTTFDPSLRRLSFWHPDAGFLRSVNLADEGSLESFPSDAWPWRDSLIVLQLSVTPREAVPAGTGVRRWPMRAHFTLRDRTGKIVRSSPNFDATYTGLDERGDSRLPFANRPFVALARDRVYFGSGDAFQVTY